MITIFNRKELFVTFDMAKYAEITSLLASQNIDYTVKAENLNNRSSVGAQPIGHIGEKLMIEHKIYVKKTDYDQAIFAMNNRH